MNNNASHQRRDSLCIHRINIHKICIRLDEHLKWLFRTDKKGNCIINYSRGNFTIDCLLLAKLKSSLGDVKGSCSVIKTAYKTLFHDSSIISASFASSPRRSSTVLVTKHRRSFKKTASNFRTDAPRLKKNYSRLILDTIKNDNPSQSSFECDDCSQNCNYSSSSQSRTKSSTVHRTGSWAIDIVTSNIPSTRQFRNLCLRADSDTKYDRVLHQNDALITSAQPTGWKNSTARASAPHIYLGVPQGSLLGPAIPLSHTTFNLNFFFIFGVLSQFLHVLVPSTARFFFVGW
jgi:hypothetical protein